MPYDENDFKINNFPYEFVKDGAVPAHANLFGFTDSDPDHVWPRAGTYLYPPKRDWELLIDYRWNEYYGTAPFGVFAFALPEVGADGTFATATQGFHDRAMFLENSVAIAGLQLFGSDDNTGHTTGIQIADALPFSEWFTLPPATYSWGGVTGAFPQTTSKLRSVGPIATSPYNTVVVHFRGLLYRRFMLPGETSHPPVLSNRVDHYYEQGSNPVNEEHRDRELYYFKGNQFDGGPTVTPPVGTTTPP